MLVLCNTRVGSFASFVYKIKIRYSYGRNKENSALIVSGMSIQVPGSLIGSFGRSASVLKDRRQPIV
jgi:hypothetical protein